LPPVTANTKTIVTIHDLSFVKVPDAAPAPLKRFLDRVVPHSIRKASHVIADSQATKNDIVDIYGTIPSKISVVLSGVDDAFNPTSLSHEVRAKYGIPNRPYVFSLGTVQPRKNYSRVIQALARMGQPYKDVVFVIAGGKGWLEDEMYRTIQDTKMTDRVFTIGFAEDVDLPALYSGAVITLVPSLYEGFGFPVLESMACGTPVITSNLSSLPEIAGDAAIIVNPHSIEEIAEAIALLLNSASERQRLSQAGVTRASLFTWQRSAMQLLEVYSHVLQRPLPMNK
jgi:glycosyltransferase involved in cell wall biosynthesis